MELRWLTSPRRSLCDTGHEANLEMLQELENEISEMDIDAEKDEEAAVSMVPDVVSRAQGAFVSKCPGC